MSNVLVTAAKASPCGKEIVPDVEIRISADVPDLSGEDWERQYDAFYNNEARRIVDALKTGLPGGTLQRVMALLVTDFGRHLRVNGWAAAETTAEIELRREAHRREDAERRAESAQDNVRSLEQAIEQHAEALGTSPVFADMKAEIERLKSATKEAF